MNNYDQLVSPESTLRVCGTLKCMMISGYCLDESRNWRRTWKIYSCINELESGAGSLVVDDEILGVRLL